jgi:ribosomal protein S18 acetylase RimI-like enzyme
MHTSFVPINLDDLKIVLQLFKEAAEKIAKMNINHWQYWKNPPKEKVDWVKEGLKSKEFYFIKNTNDELIGMIRILHEDRMYWGIQQEKALYIHSLVVREQFEGKGLGNIIINTVAEMAKNLNYLYLRLDADAKNPKLCKYYTKLGFDKVGEKTLPLSSYNLYQKEIRI